MYKLIALFAAFAVSHALYPTDEWVTTVKGVPQESGVIILDENFDYIDYDFWQHEITMSGGGNWEFQVYHNNRSNSYVKDGILYIMPGLLSDIRGEEFLSTGLFDINGGSPADECTNPSFYGCQRIGTGDNYLNPTTSARIRTVNSFYFKYGKVEIRAKMPRGDWLWPAMWMLPRMNAWNGWPASGEIDICESRGNKDLSMNGVQIGDQQISQTLHYGPFWPVNGYTTAHWEKNLAATFSADFHLYGVEWTPDYIAFSIDDEEIGRVEPTEEEGMFGNYPFDQEVDINTINHPWQPEKGATKMTPFDEEYYLILNLAVGGTNGFFPDEAVPGKPWSNMGNTAFRDFWMAHEQWYPTWEGEAAALQIDYVRVWSI